MIINKEKVIEIIAKFLSDYIKSTNLTSFYIHLNNPHPAQDFTIKICEKAREKCGANVYFNEFYEGQEKRYTLAKPIVFGECHKSLKISPICRTDGIILRDFSKDDRYDVYPLLDLYFSEIISLNGPTENIPEKFRLFNTDNHNELEYIDKENSINKIIISDESPTKHKDWYRYTKPQKDLIAKLHAREKATRHKDLLSRGALYPRVREHGIKII